MKFYITGNGGYEPRGCISEIVTWTFAGIGILSVIALIVLLLV